MSSAAVKSAAVFVHRWLGVSLCLLFLLWFLSGIGMMYWGFPGVTPDDRLEHSAALDPTSVRLSPDEAFARLGVTDAPTQIRLNTFDGRPVYRFGLGGADSLVYADSGARQAEVSQEMRLRIASAWARLSPEMAIATPVTEVDQWTVGAGLRNLRPLWKYSWPAGDEVYVDGRTGEVVQSTTTASRIGAYLGPIPHWLYFTPLRKHHVAWSRIVVWTSAAGTITALLGIVVGVWTFSPQKRYRYAGASTSIPYRGPKRWHTVLGLIFGLAAVTWVFSGMLSMEPFPLETAESLEAGALRSRIEQALLQPAPMEAFAPKSPRDTLLQLGSADVKQLDLVSVAGAPTYLATLASRDSRLVPVPGEPVTALDPDRILDIVRRAARPVRVTDATVLERYDAYYIDRHGERPLPVLRVHLGDNDGARYYIDPKSARIVGSYRSGRWMNRWLYHGLHSLDFPWLYNHRPLWDIVVIVLMAGGTALCGTSVILAWRVVRRR